MQPLLNHFSIDETYTRPTKKQKVFNRVKENVYDEPHYNYMADLLELPKTNQGFHYLFVMVDLATNLFDIQQMKNKEAKTTLQAMQSIFGRKILIKPRMSITTDNGGEFKGVVVVELLVLFGCFDDDCLGEIGVIFEVLAGLLLLSFAGGEDSPNPTPTPTPPTPPPPPRLFPRSSRRFSSFL